LFAKSGKKVDFEAFCRGWHAVFVNGWMSASFELSTHEATHLVFTTSCDDRARVEVAKRKQRPYAVARDVVNFDFAISMTRTRTLSEAAYAPGESGVKERVLRCYNSVDRARDIEWPQTLL